MKTIIFLHIPKTAGTSLRNMITKIYPGPQCLLLYYPAPYSPDTIHTIEQQLSPAKILYGHVSFGIHQLLGVKDPQYMTFLRHPFARVISLYHHYARTEGTPYYSAIRGGLSLPAFLERRLTHETNNHMTRILSGYSKPGILDEDKVLEQALSNLDQYFSFVGLTDQFEKSVALLAQQLNWARKPAIPRLNVGKNTSKIIGLNSETQPILEKYNRLDKLLYERICQRFEQQTGEIQK